MAVAAIISAVAVLTWHPPAYVAQANSVCLRIHLQASSELHAKLAGVKDRRKLQAYPYYVSARQYRRYARSLSLIVFPDVPQRKKPPFRRLFDAQNRLAAAFMSIGKAYEAGRRPALEDTRAARAANGDIERTAWPLGVNRCS